MNPCACGTANCCTSAPSAFGRAANAKAVARNAQVTKFRKNKLQHNAIMDTEEPQHDHKCGRCGTTLECQWKYCFASYSDLQLATLDHGLTSSAIDRLEACASQDYP